MWPNKQNAYMTPSRPLNSRTKDANTVGRAYTHTSTTMYVMTGMDSGHTSGTRTTTPNHTSNRAIGCDLSPYYHNRKRRRWEKGIRLGLEPTWAGRNLPHGSKLWGRSGIAEGPIQGRRVPPTTRTPGWKIYAPFLKNRDGINWQ